MTPTANIIQSNKLFSCDSDASIIWTWFVLQNMPDYLKVFIFFQGGSRWQVIGFMAWRGQHLIRWPTCNTWN